MGKIEDLIAKTLEELEKEAPEALMQSLLKSAQNMGKVAGDCDVKEILESCEEIEQGKMKMIDMLVLSYFINGGILLRSNDEQGEDIDEQFFEKLCLDLSEEIQ